MSLNSFHIVAMNIIEEHPQEWLVNTNSAADNAALHPSLEN